MNIFPLRPIKIIIIFVIIFSSVLTADSKDTDSKIYKFNKTQIISILIPKEWQELNKSVSEKGNLRLKYTPSAENESVIGYIIFDRNRCTGIVPSCLNALTQESADKTLLKAVEPKLEIKEIADENISGYYFSATDKKDKPGKHKYMKQGYVEVSSILVWFAVLTNSENEEAFKMTKQALSSIKVSERTPALQLNE